MVQNIFFLTQLITKGGIVDDCIISNAEEFLYLVVNAGCYTRDMIHIRNVEASFKAKGKDVSVDDWVDRSLLALQGKFHFISRKIIFIVYVGPLAEKVLSKHLSSNSVERLQKLKFFQGGFFSILGSDCYIQRSGYTGEDGFEVFEIL